MGDESDNPEADWREWITPKAALDLFETRGVAWDTAARMIATRLSMNLVGSIAQNFEDNRRVGRAYQRLSNLFWLDWASGADNHFWETGDRDVWKRTGVDTLLQARLVGVRFNREQIMALLPQPALAEPTTPHQAQPVIEKKTPPRSELEKFARAIYSEWPNEDDEWVWKKAQLFFAENRVPRDHFREIFRVIRGHRNPGKRPKKTD